MLILPDHLPDGQARMNRSTWGQWDWYSQHRVRIERLIVPQSRGGSICILGAGNCNDLDLPWLLQVYQHVHLVDIDREAMTRGLQRQGLADEPRIILHGPVDLTGIASIVRDWKGQSVATAQVDAAIDLVLNGWGLGQMGHDHDLVLSPCVLSQLFVGVRDVLGAEHPAWQRLEAALRTRHLRTLLNLLKPGGKAVLAIDLVSSGKVPGLDRAPEHEWPAIMQMSIDRGRCFPGLEPAAIEQTLRNDPALAPIAAPPRITSPWMWHLAFSRAFLVYALTIPRQR